MSTATLDAPITDAPKASQQPFGVLDVTNRVNVAPAYTYLFPLAYSEAIPVYTGDPPGFSSVIKVANAPLWNMIV